MQRSGAGLERRLHQLEERERNALAGQALGEL